MKSKVIPAKYAWIKSGVKVRHVKMSADNLWMANELPAYSDGEWKVIIRDLCITVPCEFLMSEDDPPIYDSKGNFPDEMMGPFYTLERDDGFWECGHSGAGTAAYGQTEKEAMKRFLMQYDMLTGHLVIRGMTLSNESETLAKARAVLADKKELMALVKTAADPQNICRPQAHLRQWHIEECIYIVAALADALEGGGDE